MERLVGTDVRTGEAQPIFVRNNRILTGFDFGRTFFNEMIVAEYSPELELDSTNGLSLLLRDKDSSTGSATVSESNGEFALATGTTSASSAILITQEHGRYQSGIVGTAGIGFRIGDEPTGDEEYLWGYFDDDNGFLFGKDATGLFIEYRNNGVVEERVYQPNWNGNDKLDGTGPSGLTLSTSKLSIYRVDYVAYGAGPAEWKVLTVNEDGDFEVGIIHRRGAPEGKNLLSQWKLQVRAEVKNNSTGRNITGYIGGRQFGVYGRYFPQTRTTGQEFTGVTVGTGYTHLCTFKKRPGTKNQHKSVKLREVDLITDADVIIAVVVGASLASSASFVIPDNVASTETCLLTNVAASAISLVGSTAIYKSVAAGGQGNKAALSRDSRLANDLPDESEVSLIAKTISGSGTVSGVFILSEEW